jgi:hypothetical protein
MHDPHAIDADAEDAGGDLGERRLVPLPVRRRPHADRRGAVVLDGHRAVLPA